MTRKPKQTPLWKVTIGSSVAYYGDQDTAMIRAALMSQHSNHIPDITPGYFVPAKPKVAPKPKKRGAK